MGRAGGGGSEGGREKGREVFRGRERRREIIFSHEWVFVEQPKQLTWIGRDRGDIYLVPSRQAEVYGHSIIFDAHARGHPVALIDMLRVASKPPSASFWGVQRSRS